MFTVVLNPASGSAGDSTLEKRILALFRAEGEESRVIALKPGDVDSAVRDILKSNPRGVIAGGGDGTVNSVAAALSGGVTPMGVLPLGTLNHFAKDLKIPLDLEQAVRTITAGHRVAVDLGSVNDRVFVNNSSIGIYPSIVERREELRRQGHGKWPALAVATADILARSGEVSVRLDVDGTRVVTRTPFVFVGNNEYEVAGIHVGARKRLNGGQLFSLLAPRVKARELPKLILHALLSRAGRQEELTSLSGTEMWIETFDKRRVSVSTDGEVAHMVTPLHYRSMPGALSVFAPPAV